MSRDGHRWTIISRHGLILIFLGRNSECTVAEISAAVGITPRQTFRIVKDLVGDGYLHVGKKGRRNVYSLKPEKSLRHPLVDNITIADLLNFATANT